MSWIRLRIAEAWDRLFPRSCWLQNCGWAWGFGRLRISEHCPTDCDGNRNCWCGKKRATRPACHTRWTGRD